jgi:HNH endonuclease
MITPENMKRRPRSDIGKKHNISEDGRKKLQETGMALGESWKGKKRASRSPEHTKVLIDNLIRHNTGKKKGPLTPEWRKSISEGTKKGMTPEICSGISARQKLLIGPLSPKWIEDRSRLKNCRQGIDPYALDRWRIAIFERDDYTCQKCRKRGGRLNADHIRPVLFFPELALDLDNGRTLCLECHVNTETFGGKIHRFTRESFEVLLNERGTQGI